MSTKRSGRSVLHRNRETMARRRHRRLAVAVLGAVVITSLLLAWVVVAMHMKEHSLTVVTGQIIPPDAADIAVIND